jgi:sporulation protein YlmC with PRC-barrel domain
LVIVAATALVALVGVTPTVVPGQVPPPSMKVVWLADFIGADVIAVDASTPVGRIEDLIVDLDAGRVSHVSVLVDTKSVQLPYGDLSLEGAGRTYRVPLTAAEIGSLPAVVAPPLQVAAPPRAKASGDSGRKDSDPSQGKEGPQQTFADAAADVAPIAAAASFRGVEVSVAGRVVGKVEDLVFEVRRGALAFVEIQSGTEPGQRGSMVWVPWAACSVQAVRGSGRETAAPVVVIDPKGRDLSDAPAAGAGVLSDPLFRQRIYDFFAVASPPYEKRP